MIFTTGTLSYQKFLTDKFNLKQLYIYILLFFLQIFGIAAAEDVYVGKEREFNDIGSAVVYAKDGDRIFIEQGIYFAAGLIIDKSLTITGINSPVIDAQNISEAVIIRAPGVIFEGITIRNIPVGFMKDNAGLRIENTKNVTVRNNRFENNFFALYFSGCSDFSAVSNVITGQAESESFSGNGIHLWNCNNADIMDNFISGYRDGIYFEFVTNSRISGNYSEKNLRYGLHFMFSEGNSYVKNTFRENGAGVAVMYTKKVEMIENIFEDNWGPSSYGLLLKDISKSRIINNIFRKNTTGIFAEGSSEVFITNNSFYENGWAMKILGNCTDDTIIRNNFYSNTFDISTNSSVNRNYFISNYWDRYTGYDLNRDNTGDVPYRPVSMFSMLVEQTPEAILLVRSFLVDLIDLTEKVIPVFIPETLIDNYPSMNLIPFENSID